MAWRQGVNWDVPTRSENGTSFTWEHVAIHVLMDIRAELQKLNRVFACPNFQAVPRILRRISANTSKPKRRRKAQ